MHTGVDDLRGILAAYKQVMDASWPQLHPTMADASRQWAQLGERELAAELAGYVKQSSTSGSSVRVFWKIGPKFTFAGCNELFAQDAGLPSTELIGTDDFDKRLPWTNQAAKYRADDRAVAQSGEPNLDIIERQTSASGTITWVRAGKTPIRGARGAVIGILGMYELLDSATGSRLFGDQQIRKAKPQKP
jgi:PAS domain-containing protein